MQKLLLHPSRVRYFGKYKNESEVLTDRSPRLERPPQPLFLGSNSLLYLKGQGMLALWSYSLLEDNVRLSWRILFRFSVVLRHASPQQKWGEFYRDIHGLRNRGAPYTGMCADFFRPLSPHRLSHELLGIRAVRNECCKTEPLTSGSL